VLSLGLLTRWTREALDAGRAEDGALVDDVTALVAGAGDSPAERTEPPLSLVTNAAGLDARRPMNGTENDEH
jgi:hypothetical protein